MQACIDRWTDGKGAILVGSSWDRYSPPLLCPLATKKKKKCLVEFLQDFSFNLMHLSNTNANANNRPLSFYRKQNYWNAGLASTQRICFWLDLEVQGLDRVCESVLAGGRGGFLGKLFWGKSSSCLSKIMDTLPTKTNKGTELCEGRHSC